MGTVTIAAVRPLTPWVVVERAAVGVEHTSNPKSVPVIGCVGDAPLWVAREGLRLFVRPAAVAALWRSVAFHAVACVCEQLTC